MNVLLFKLNGWPSTYDERIRALSDATDLTFIRSAPIDDADNFDDLDNVTLYQVYPRRGSYVTPAWTKPIVFTAHVLQAILIALFLALYRHRSPDVIHGMDYVLGGFAALVTASVLRRPLVVSVRGYKEPVYRSMMENVGTLRSRINYKLLVLLSRTILARADYVITKADYQREAVRSVVDSEPRFATIPTGVDFEKFDPTATSGEDYLDKLFSEQMVDLPEEQFRLLYLGQLIEQKGVDTILRHVRDTGDELPGNLVVVIVGEFRTASFRREVKRLQGEIERPVFVHSTRIPLSDVPELLSSVDTVVLLSEPAHEGVPRVLQEACAMGVPIIASDVVGISGAFSDLPGCFLVERDDSESFAQAINEVYTGSPRMDRKTLMENFDMYDNYRKYVEIYRQCLDAEKTNAWSAAYHNN